MKHNGVILLYILEHPPEEEPHLSYIVCHVHIHTHSMCMTQNFLNFELNSSLSKDSFYFVVAVS